VPSLSYFAGHTRHRRGRTPSGVGRGRRIYPGSVPLGVTRLFRTLRVTSRTRLAQTWASLRLRLDNPSLGKHAVRGGYGIFFTRPQRQRHAAGSDRAPLLWPIRQRWETATGRHLPDPNNTVRLQGTSRCARNTEPLGRTDIIAGNYESAADEPAARQPRCSASQAVVFELLRSSYVGTRAHGCSNGQPQHQRMRALDSPAKRPPSTAHSDQHGG